MYGPRVPEREHLTHRRLEAMGFDTIAVLGTCDTAGAAARRFLAKLAHRGEMEKMMGHARHLALRHGLLCPVACKDERVCHPEARLAQVPVQRPAFRHLERAPVHGIYEVSRRHQEVSERPAIEAMFEGVGCRVARGVGGQLEGLKIEFVDRCQTHRAFLAGWEFSPPCGRFREALDPSPDCGRWFGRVHSHVAGVGRPPSPCTPNATLVAPPATLPRALAPLHEASAQVPVLVVGADDFPGPAVDVSPFNHLFRAD
mmetsp:Transcript_75044/g.208661  ORF Transcript_75044/g.208661 Transcript_75044/m.208661 type:complete len:257 (-) Transcript_75044:69-839(-)